MSINVGWALVIWLYKISETFPSTLGHVLSLYHGETECVFDPSSETDSLNKYQNFECFISVFS